MNKTVFSIVLSLLICVSVRGQDSEHDPWAPLQPFVGKWVGERTGMGGDAKQSTELKFVLDGKFLQCETKTLAGKDPHADIGMISYDNNRKKFIYRSFFSEGFVNTYVGTVSDDGKSVEFVTESVENGPAGLRAKEIWTLVGNKLNVECHLANADQPFKRCIEAVMIRKTDDATK